MIEIKFTMDATPALLCTLQDLAGAIRDAAHTVTPIPPSNHSGPRTPRACPAELREALEKDGAAEKAKNLPSGAPVDGEHPETRESVEEPKKRKPRAKKAPSESNTPVAPAMGDNLSPDGVNAEPEQATQEETHATAPVAEEPAPEILTPARVEETPAPEPAPVEEAPAAPAEDPLAGKGQTGEILAELTRKAIGDLDALGVDRGDANRRIRDYCVRNEIKFPTFPALLNAVGYAEAIAICKGA